MKLTESHEILAEQKIKILYILNKLNKPVSNDGLLQLVLSIDEMNYFYFQQFLLDLIDNKYVDSNKTEEGETLYSINDFGIKSLSLVLDMLPGITKLKIDDTIKQNFEIVNEQDSITAEYTPTNQKDFTVTCKIRENNSTIFEITTFSSSREQAKEITENWKKNAVKNISEILEILTKKNE